MTTYAGEDVEQGNTPQLQVEMQTCTVTMEINIAVSQKIGNQTTSRLNYITLEHIPKEHITSTIFIETFVKITRN